MLRYPGTGLSVLLVRMALALGNLVSGHRGIEWVAGKSWLSGECVSYPRG